MDRPVIGLALGSGSARGWAHIGIIRALEEAGLRPDIVCGSSVGALVGAAYVSGRLGALEDWVRTLTWWDVVKFMDVRLIGGGVIEGGRLMEAIGRNVPDERIETLSTTFVAVATDLVTGRERWLREGPLLDAVRASIALPGLFTPVRVGGRWLFDGGLVNPVPVSVCRALGAEVTIAANLNGDIVGKHLATTRQKQARQAAPGEDPTAQLLARINDALLRPGGRPGDEKNATPGLFDVMASALNIMQDRITRSRMAGDPPDIMVSPRLAHIGLLEFDRASEAITEGRRCVERAAPVLQQYLGTGD